MEFLRKLKLEFLKISEKREILKDFIREKKGALTLSILGFLQFYLLTKVLSISDLGKYIIFSSLAIAFSAFFEFGVPIAVIKYLPISKNKSKTLSKFLALQILVGILLFPIFYILSPHISLILFKEKSNIAFLSVIAGLMDSIILTLRNSLVGLMDFEARKNFLPLEGVLKIILIISLAIKKGLIGAITGYLFSDLIIIGVYLLYLFRKRIYFYFSLPKLSLEEVFNLINFNFISISRNIYYITDLLIVGALLNPIKVSIYKIASLFGETLMQLVNLREILAPRFSKWSIDNVKKALFKIIILHSVIAFVLILLLSILAKPLILLLFGKEYLPAVKLVILMSFLILIDALSYFNLVFEMKDLPWISTISIIILVITNSILDYILVPIFDVYGAIYATLLSYALSYIIPVTFYFVRKKF